MEASTPNCRENPAPVAAAALESIGVSGSLLPLQTPQPVPLPIANAPPPFLVKIYEMVDDPNTDKIVSWSSTNNSFVVWDQPEFTRNLLPKYFKHNNYSSFVRQLNTYGFRKVDPDRQEFANEGFLRGQKHLLKTINRRKGSQGNVQQPRGENISAGPCIEVGKFGLEEEVERLKRDKNVLMQELVRLHQQQQATDTQLQTMVQHLQGMEQRQQQMMSFLAKAVNSPGFLAQFVQQQQNDSSSSSRRIITERSKKRRLKQDDDDPTTITDGQIVKYQPLINEAAKAMLKQLVKLDTSPSLDNFSNTCDNSFLISNGSGVSLQDMEHSSSSLPLPSPITDTSDIQHVESQNIQISRLPGIISPESNDDDISYDNNQIDWERTLLDVEDMIDLPGSNDPFWEKFLKSTPSNGFDTEHMDSSTMLEDLSKEMLKQQVNGGGGWEKSQHLEELTTQMRNLV